MKQPFSMREYEGTLEEMLRESCEAHAFFIIFLHTGGSRSFQVAVKHGPGIIFMMKQRWVAALGCSLSSLAERIEGSN